MYCFFTEGTIPVVTAFLQCPNQIIFVGVVQNCSHSTLVCFLVDRSPIGALPEIAYRFWVLKQQWSQGDSAYLIELTNQTQRVSSCLLVRFANGHVEQPLVWLVTLVGLFSIEFRGRVHIIIHRTRHCPFDTLIYNKINNRVLNSHT